MSRLSLDQFSDEQRAQWRAGLGAIGLRDEAGRLWPPKDADQLRKVRALLYEITGEPEYRKYLTAADGPGGVPANSPLLNAWEPRAG